MPRHCELQDSGGEKHRGAGAGPWRLSGSRPPLLIQSSTVAHVIEAEFDDGHGGRVRYPISDSYVEFAQRRPLPSVPVQRNISSAGKVQRPRSGAGYRRQFLRIKEKKS